MRGEDETVDDMDLSRFYYDDYDVEDREDEEAITQYGDAGAQELEESLESVSEEEEPLDAYIDLEPADENDAEDFDLEFLSSGETQETVEAAAEVVDLDIEIGDEVPEQELQEIAEAAQAVSEVSGDVVEDHSYDSIIEVEPLSDDEEIVISVDDNLSPLTEVAPLGDEIPEPVRSRVVDESEAEEEGISIDVPRLPDEFYEQLEELELVYERQYKEVSLEQIPSGYPMLSKAFNYATPAQNLPVLEAEHDQQDEQDEQGEAYPQASGESVRMPAAPGESDSRSTDEDSAGAFLEEEGEVSDVEDLEAADLPDTHEPHTTDAPDDQFEKRMAGLREQGEIELYTIAELVEELQDYLNPVEFREGVFQVSDGAFRSEETQEADGKLSELIDDVTAKDEVSGIDALFAKTLETDELPVDFFPDNAADESQSEIQSRQKKLLIEEDGINFDQYVTAGSGSQSSLKELRGLTKVSRVFNALSAVILTSGEEGLHVEHGIGLEDTNTDGLLIPYSSTVYERILANRYFLFLRTKTTGIPTLDSLFREEGSRSFNSSLFMPIIFRGKPAYLFLGIKQSDIDIISSLRQIFRY